MTKTFDHIKRVACIGEVMIELVDDRQERPRLGVAGDTFNTAVYLRRALHDPDVVVSYVTALGTDRFSKKILDACAEHDLDTNHVELRPDRVPGIYMIETSDDGERSFSYWRAQSAARTLFQAPGRVSFASLQDFDLVLLTGISLAILPPEIRAGLFDALDAFRARGGLVAYDSNHRPTLWESPEIARAANMAMWARADLALPSVDDEFNLFGEDHEDQVIARLNSVGADFGALKRGPLGPKRMGGADTAAIYPPVETVVDTTAAGDSFNAGVLAGLVNGSSLDAALMDGHRLSSKVIQAHGAILPD